MPIAGQIPLENSHSSGKQFLFSGTEAEHAWHKWAAVPAALLLFPSRESRVSCRAEGPAVQRVLQCRGSWRAEGPAEQTPPWDRTCRAPRAYTVGMQWGDGRAVAVEPQPQKSWLGMPLLLQGEGRHICSSPVPCMCQGRGESLPNHSGVRSLLVLRESPSAHSQ